jgi:hypothetical protein
VEGRGGEKIVIILRLSSHISLCREKREFEEGGFLSVRMSLSLSFSRKRRGIKMCLKGSSERSEEVCSRGHRHTHIFKVRQND